MMSKRIKLARRLLSKKGIIITSIDEYEVHNIRHLLDEIFGEENKLGMVTVLHNPKGRNLSAFFSSNSEFMFVYAKNINFAEFNDITIDEDKKLSFDFEDKLGNYRWQPFLRARTVWSRKNKPRNWYPIYVSKDLLTITLDKNLGYHELLPITPNGQEMAWKNVADTFKKLNIDNYFKAEREGERIELYHKYREQQIFKNVWTDKKYQSEFNGTNLLKKILGGNLFDYPKSLYLVLDIIKITSEKNSIILDFFAGSGTTAHAVLELNKEDKGQRKFVLCTNNEKNICTEVCYPRISKVIKGYKNIKGETIKGLGGNLRYYKTEFVDAKQTDRNKKLLTEKATDMLCIKEDTYNEINTKNKHFRIFKNGKKYTGIIYDYMEIDSFKKFIKKIDGRFSVYIFSLGDDTFDEEFEDLGNNVKLSPVPEAIMRVYRRMFK